MSASIKCGCGGTYKKYTQNRHNKTQKHTHWKNTTNNNSITSRDRMNARECVLRALQEIRKIQKILKTNNITPPPPPPTPPPRSDIEGMVTEIPGWKTIPNSYANLQNVYSTKMDGKSIHAFPFHDLKDTEKFVCNLKKCEGFTINHRSNTFYVHRTIDTIYDNTNKEKNTTKKQNWHTLYIKH